MSCGAVAWWRAPDFVGLLERHGQVEHLVVQFDFLTQLWRDPRAEYSIPGASKSRMIPGASKSLNGTTGYADIVSIGTKEIWEIKPKHLEDQAFSEAAWYVKNAKVSCGPQWQPGSSFSTSNLFGGGGVVYRLEGNGNKAELIAQQGRRGTVLYSWRINGKEVPSLVPYFSWALRGQIITDYFSAGQPPQPLAGSKSPNNFPPVKFKPPVLTPDACIPQLGKFILTLLKSIHTTCAQTVLENSSVAVLLEASVFNALVGPGLVANQISMLQVKGANPTVTLYREAMTVLTGAAAAHGVIGVAVGLTAVLYLLIEGAVLLGSVIILACEATPLAATPVLASEGFMGSLVASVRAAHAGLRAAVAAGAAILVFVTPRASSANPGAPVAGDVSFPKFVVLKPSQANARVGQSMTIDGSEWIIAGIARTPPDELLD